MLTCHPHDNSHICNDNKIIKILKFSFILNNLTKKKKNINLKTKKFEKLNKKLK